MTIESLAASPHEIREKERRVREFLAERHLDALVLTTQANFAWFTCGGENRVGNASDAGSSSIVVTPDAKYIICDNIEARRIADEEVGSQGFEIRSYNWWESSLSDELKRLFSTEIGADTPIPGTKLVAGDISPLRYSLTDREVQRYRWLGKAAGECLADACYSVRPGMTEHEMAAVLGEKLFARGILPTLILVAADDRVRHYRHPIPTDKAVENYAMLVVGARKWGLLVSATRMVHFGEVGAELRRLHDSVMSVDAELIARTRPGTSIAYIFCKGMKAYAQAGYPDEWHLHHQGGPTGYAGRDFRAKPTVHGVIVQKNQAFAWNPSITGTKTEDTIIALEDHTEIISAAGDWPMVPIEAASMVVMRPDILGL